MSGMEGNLLPAIIWAIFTKLPDACVHKKTGSDDSDKDFSPKFLQMAKKSNFFKDF